jgi:hypothetical protein
MSMEPKHASAIAEELAREAASTVVVGCRRDKFDAAIRTLDVGPPG